MAMFMYHCSYHNPLLQLNEPAEAANNNNTSNTKAVNTFVENAKLLTTNIHWKDTNNIWKTCQLPASVVG